MKNRHFCAFIDQITTVFYSRNMKLKIFYPLVNKITHYKDKEKKKLRNHP